MCPIGLLDVGFLLGLPLQAGTWLLGFGVRARVSGFLLLARASLLGLGVLLLGLSWK